MDIEQALTIIERSIVGMVHHMDGVEALAVLNREIERLTFDNERLRSGLRGIRREFGYKSINNGTSTLGGFIDMLLINDVAGAKRMAQGVSDEKRNV